MNRHPISIGLEDAEAVTGHRPAIGAAFMSERVYERLARLMTVPAAVRPYGFRLESCAEGRCTVRVPCSPAVLGPGGLVAGPVFMAAADFTMWLAMLTLDASAASAVTVELTTSFLGSARDQDVLCTAVLLKRGRRLVFGVADCTTEEGRHLTHHVITYATIEATRPPDR